MLQDRTLFPLLLLALARAGLAPDARTQEAITAHVHVSSTGQDIVQVQGNMGINKGDFNALVEVLQQTMNAQGIPLAAQLAPMHRDIITAE